MIATQTRSPSEFLKESCCLPTTLGMLNSNPRASPIFFASRMSFSTFFLAKSQWVVITDVIRLKCCEHLTKSGDFNCRVFTADSNKAHYFATRHTQNTKNTVCFLNVPAVFPSSGSFWSLTMSQRWRILNAYFLCNSDSRKKLVFFIVEIVFRTSVTWLRS